MRAVLELIKDEHRAQLNAKGLGALEECRLCAGHPLAVRWTGREEWLWPKLTQRDIEAVVQTACRQSVYAHTETLRQGYITIDGGHRVGICGAGVIQDGSVQMIHNVSSVVIRIARQIMGCADGLLDKLTGSALILGPPCSGKTTLLRDLVRQISDRGKMRVGLVDERGELSASVLGVSQLNIGMRTDVLVNVPKATGAMMLLRNMAPQWVAMDEITSPEDIGVMELISYCGVYVLATAHGKSMKDLFARPLYRNMMDKGIFRQVILLGADKSYTVQEVNL